MAQLRRSLRLALKPFQIALVVQHAGVRNFQGNESSHRRVPALPYFAKRASPDHKLEFEPAKAAHLLESHSRFAGLYPKRSVTCGTLHHLLVSAGQFNAVVAVRTARFGFRRKTELNFL